jgi:hypothetical protein
MPLNLLDADARIEVRDLDLVNVIEPDPDVVYVLRQILPATRKALQKRRPNPKTHQMEPDDEATLDAMVDYALIEWRGILHRGEPAPCTTENKALLDRGRKVALISVSVSNRQMSAEQREDSFREPAGVV